MNLAANSLRVLLVDDEPSVLEGLRIVFDDDGWMVSRAESAESALKIWEPGSMDLLLVDKNMPEMSGIDLIEKVRQRDQGVAIMILTGYASDTSALRALNLGIDSYAEKPVRDAYRLAARCRLLLSRRANRLTLERKVLAAAEPPGGAVVLCSTERRSLFETSFSDHVGPLEFVDSEPHLHDALAAGNYAVALLDSDPESDTVVLTVEKVSADHPALACVVIGETLSMGILVKLIELQGVSLINEPLGSHGFEHQLGVVLERLFRAHA